MSFLISTVHRKSWFQTVSARIQGTGFTSVRPEGDEVYHAKILFPFGTEFLGLSDYSTFFTDKSRLFSISYWFLIFRVDPIDSEEARTRFIKYAKKKWCYGNKPAKTGVTDQIHPTVALTVRLFVIFGQRWQKHVIHTVKIIGFLNWQEINIFSWF